MKDDRPNLWIYYHPRFRSPGSTDLYKYWKNESKSGNTKFNVTLITDTGMGVTADRVAKKWNIPLPDVVLDGFGGYVGVARSQPGYSETEQLKLTKDKIALANQINSLKDAKIIRTIGDVEVHKGDFGGGHHLQNTHMDVDAIYFPVSPDTPSVDRVLEYTEDLPAQRDAKLICVPFGVDHNKYNPNNAEKDIDLSIMWMAEGANMFHANRLTMERTIFGDGKNPGWIQRFNGAYWNWKKNIKDKVEQAPKACTMEEIEEHKYFNNKRNLVIVKELDFYNYGPLRTEKKEWDGYTLKNRTGEFKILRHGLVNRSKVGLCDSSRRQYMTNKYLEFGSAGCGIIGELPFGYDDLLKDCMFPIDMERIPEELPKMIEYVFFDEQGKRELHKRTGKLRKKIVEGYTLKHWMDKLEGEFSKLLN